MAPTLPEVEVAEAHEAALPLARPYRTASTGIEERSMILVRAAAGGLDGWGECSPVPGYSRESLEDCRDWLLTALPRLTTTGGLPPDPGPPAAAFALEAALADLASRGENVPLWQRLGGTREWIEIGAVVGLDVPTPEIAATASGLAEAGYRRIKLKIAPGEDRDRLDAARTALPGAVLAADANGSYPPDDPPGFVDRFGLSFLEQPFPAGAWDETARLARSIETPLCLDESITGAGAAIRAVETGAAAIVNVKPARLGGLAAAAAVLDAVLSRNGVAWCGGMVEGGIGKAAALAVASLPGMSLPADLPPSGRHLAEDPAYPPWTMEEGRIRLSGRPGIGVRPDPASLERHTLRVTRFGRS